ncbi:MAG TPA: tetratricopeptide repeat protein [Geminicoccaceae bacterium]|nr:tetratricopeptide repeat protein [Geminicoccus sp.]HMU49998.1 tetratricopeptide repeat protein [Geminicoccaceae bacterium]
MERRLAAILAGDVVGYSRMMADDEAGTYDNLRAGFSEVVIPSVEDHGGRVFKTTGDGFLAVFPSVGEALAAAVAIRDGFAGRSLQLRLGLNLGDVIEEGGDVFGDGVNVAARLEAMAEPGAIYASAAVVRAAGRNTGFGFTALGSRRGKNLPDPIEIYQVERSPVAGRWRGGWRMAGAVAGLAVLLSGATAFAYRERLGTMLEAEAPVEVARVSDGGPVVAVLPFDNLSGDPGQDYFTDGLTEDIITDLARYGELQVIARNSTFAFKGRATDIRAVGAELGAGYVVEGSARRVGDQLRVVAQLIDADSGAHIWSRSYDRRVEDVFSVQSDLTTRIVASLVSYVRQSEFDGAAQNTEDPRVYDLVLRARDRYKPNSLDPVRLEESRRLYQQAIELDPNYAAAHARLGLTYILDHMSQVTGPASEAQLAQALGHIRQAIRLQPDLTLGYQGLSYALAQSGDYAGGMRAAERAVALTPSDPDSLMALAKAQVRFGAYDEAVRNAEQARRLHPLAPQYYPYVHAQSLYAAGRPADADNVLADCLLGAPEERSCILMQAAVLARLDRVDEARAAMARLLRLDPRFTLASERASRRFGDSPLMEQFLADLELAGAPPGPGQAGGPPGIVPAG